MIMLLLAGALQLAIAAANLPLSWMLQFGREQRRLTPIVRQIHQVHHAYIAGLLVVFGALSITFPDELSGGAGLGRVLSAVLALFWGARFVVQRFYYDRDFLRRHRAGDVAFSLIFAFLSGVYAASAAGALR
ncbi:MAG: hypothetical protein HY293_20420 [Planctomycetes bacterium]|nr:hypothetical protein [Planctomycetota bacterium]